MAIQEKLVQAFDELKQGKFGESTADSVAVEAEKKYKKTPDKATDDQLKTLLVLDIARILTTAKGVEGLTQVLDRLEAQYPKGSIGTVDQKAVDTISTEIERHLKTFAAEKNIDQQLFRELGISVKNKDWDEAARLLRDEVAESLSKNEIIVSQADYFDAALDVIQNGDASELKDQLSIIDAVNDAYDNPTSGETHKQLERLDRIEVSVTRRSLKIMEQPVLPVDVEPTFKVTQSVVAKKTEVLQGLDSLKGKADIPPMDIRILSQFQRELDDDWSKISSGVDLESWAKGNEDREITISEVNSIVNHILYLEKAGVIPASSPEQREYLTELQQATSAVKRLWREREVREGELATPVEQTTPEIRKRIKINQANIELINQLQNGDNFAAWAHANRDWRPEDITDEGVSVESELFKLVGRGLINYKNGVITWLVSREEFFDEVSQLARDVSAIVPEVNQIPFSRSLKPRLYQMLMESEAPPGKREDLGWAKDAVFRLYTMGYVKESLWRNGGNLEALCKAALGLLGQGGEDSVYSSLFHFNETIRNIGSGILNENGKEAEILKLDLRDILDFSEHYSRLKDGKRSWLNAISSGELNKNGDGTSLPARKEFFKDYMKWVLNRQLDMGEIDVNTHAQRIGLINNNENYERIFDVYGGHYTNMVKVFESIHLRYGQVAVNQVTSGDAFEFCSPPGGEAAYKFHKNTVFKFNARYVGSAKYAPFLDGKVDTGMVSAPAYFRKETLPHFMMAHSEVGSNPGADKYFFSGVASEADKKRYAGQFVDFWKPAIFDSDDHGGKYRDTDEVRMVEDTIDIAMRQIASMSPSQLEFTKYMDYKMISNASGFNFEEIFRKKGITDPVEKFKYFVGQWGNRYYEWNTLRSKRVADFYNSYVQKSYNEVRTGAMALSLNATSEEAIMAIATAHDAYNPSTGFIEDMHENVLDQMNHEPTFLGIPLPPNPFTGLRMPKTEFGKGWKNVGMKGEKSGIDLNGKFESSLKSLIPGALKRNSYASYYSRRRDPEWTRPLILEAAYQAGELSPELFEKRMKTYKAEMYFGPKISKRGNLRWGHVFPPSTLYYGIKGYLIDKLHLDWEDIVYITKKTNEKAVEDIKKKANFKI